MSGSSRGSVFESKTKVQEESLAGFFLKVVLAVALVGGLFFAGQSIYRRLPDDASAAMQIVAADLGSETAVTVALRSDATAATLNSPVEFYPFDLAAAQREFQASPRLARQFEDYLLRRMHGVTPVKAPTDEQGRARAGLREGNWWLRATASSGNGETIEWRLPVSVAGRDQIVELTMDNAYERTKKF